MRSLAETVGAQLPAYPTRAPLRSFLRGSTWRSWLRLCGIALLVKLAIAGAALALVGASPDPVTAIVSDWFHWDAPHYLSIAQSGYVRAGDLRNLIAFFPLYPALIQALAVTGLPLEAAALLINNAGGLLATILLYEIGRHDGDERAGFRAAVIFNVFPTAYFLVNGYTEGLFCALAFASVLAARRGRFVGAGLLGGLAGAARLTGVALVPLMLCEVWMARRRLGRLYDGILAVMLPAGGLAIYLLINWIVLGDALAFVQVQRAHWYHRLSAPWVGLIEAVKSIGWRTPWEKFTVGGAELAGGMTAYVTTGLSALKLRPGDAAYAATLTVLMTFLPFWLSIPRYLLAMFPLFLLLGRIRQAAVQIPLAALSFAGLLIFSVAFARGYWAF
ncbi:MAG TPA: mannosyltransferase family protein [Candidatus Limnocylindrales bacterium]|nr:mannosyltransferase family protein [Candidatus Limnocylindrales bacterium]